MYCRQCGEHLFKGTSYCLSCHAPVTPPQRVVPIQADEEDDYTTHVVPERPQPQVAPLPYYQQPQEKKSRTSHVLAAIAGAAVAVLLLALVGVGFGIFVLLPSQSGGAQQSAPATQKTTPTPPAPSPTNASGQPATHVTSPNYYPSNANVSNANVYAPGDANVYSPPSSAPPVDLVGGTFLVENLQTRYFTFSVYPGHTGVVVGRFSATGGAGDINVMVMTMEDLARFNSLQGFSTYFNSGYSTARDFKVKVPPGDYALVFNNRRSILTSKSVTAYVQLRFE